jgi:hypothetical protein
MKLTLNRREAQEKGFFKTSTVYYLDVNLEATPEEMALIKKHQWGENLMWEGVIRGGHEQDWPLKQVVGKPHSWPFDTVEHLVYVESQVIANAKKLKQQVEADGGFTSAGPREFEL